MFRKLLLVLSVLAIVLGLAFVFGPREPADTSISFNPNAIGSDLDQYLVKSESQFADITPGAEKQIIWHDAANKQPTENVVVYIHGFSATLEEVRPLPDLVAKSLQANLFFTRLTGHGRSGDAMAEASANDWYNDVAEAMAIAKKLGQRIYVLSTSTGGTLVTQMAENTALMDQVEGLVMISPNFGVKAPGSSMLGMPFARQILPPLVGETREFEPSNAEHGKWWTTRYPSVALLPMYASVQKSLQVKVENITQRALFIYHPNDKVVDSAVSKSIAERWGRDVGNKGDVLEIEKAEDAYDHVIAGRILSPSNTIPMADQIVSWIKGTQ